MKDTMFIHRGDVDLYVEDFGGHGPPVVLLHGLAGSSREMRPTAGALRGRRVVLLDQRGHGRSTRRPGDVSRRAFVHDVVEVVERLFPEQAVDLVGQSVGAHTAFMTACARPDLVRRLVMLEGHVRGSDDPGEARRLGRYFSSWPVPFADEEEARGFLGRGALADAWIADLEPARDGLRPRFDADVMEATLAEVHVPRWVEWTRLRVPTTAVFAEAGLFDAAQRSELIECRPQTRRVDLVGVGHDAHLEAPEAWAEVLRAELA
ncbi:alpha/beta hydrolase [Kocuria polaris]|nr:alpha/beta hydrolase [Kocuria polaris]